MAMPARSPSADEFIDALDFLRSEHERQFEFVNGYLQLSHESQIESVFDSTDALISYLTVELGLHHHDEEEDLFPILKELCKIEDGIDHILAELDRDHAVENFLARIIVIDLKTIAAGKSLENPVRFILNLRAFAEGQVRHLIWENNIVLPLARERLGPVHLERMGQNIAERRGMTAKD